ncbi:hypothetical protein B2G88_12165 [Natronolimnobius baerhuensis]|uniref:Uncharacterized protein n=2 Tax=Natronolimnobius baerhuensis TaxID=253108 RepID=A0A202EA48_9EURY|nr:hypothetical protein B2G88_12165 [Natronolimnobius baerhuensis]
MSVIIEISDDGKVEATHNSGETLWAYELPDEDEFDEIDAADYSYFIRGKVATQLNHLEIMSLVKDDTDFENKYTREV